MIITNAIITAYCIASSSTNKCADNKHYPIPNYTIAVGDRSSIPLGSTILWQGKKFVAHDRMHKKYDGTHRFDLFLASKKEAQEFGIKTNQTITIGN